MNRCKDRVWKNLIVYRLSENHYGAITFLVAENLLNLFHKRVPHVATSPFGRNNPMRGAFDAGAYLTSPTDAKCSNYKRQDDLDGESV